MGLDDELNPPSHQEGYKLGLAILKDQVAPSKEGAVLTQAVCDFMTDILPGNIFKDLPEIIIRFLVGDDIAEKIGIVEERKLRDKIYPKLLGLIFHSIDDIEDSSRYMTKIISHVNLFLLQSMLNHFNEDKQVRFDIPPNLREDWNLK